VLPPCILAVAGALDFLDSSDYVLKLGCTRNCKMATKSPAKSTPVIPAKTSKPAAPVAKAGSSYKPTQEEIAARAYEIYEREGGNEQENWLRAERELIARGRR
jgi:hypothetical protein